MVGNDASATLPPRAPRTIPTAPRLASDRAFGFVSKSSGVLVLALMSAVGLFLALRAVPALADAKGSFLTTADWQPDAHHFGIAAVMVGTILIGLVAVLLAVPLALGTALYISEYAPPHVKRSLVSVVDLMAAVPSVIYGLWGLYFLTPHITGVSRWMATYLGWVRVPWLPHMLRPFEVSGADLGDPLASRTLFTSSTLIAGLVVGLMVTPIVSSIMREVFSRAPAGEREGAYALGATKWGMIRSVILPFGVGGIIGGTMLGLGRALGETIAVYLVISPVFVIQGHVLQNGTSSISSLIALRYGEASSLGISALMAAGLALFLLTLLVNFAAATIVARSRSGATGDA
ncbi:MAG: phosphate transport system permease protein [Frankiaceae bacterium]|jgi:phosphate transport system permease protein|nr:phosphate transport system permease protein [Frankiaceae bacterium]